MLNPHQISDRVAVFAGLSLLSALIVPNAFAVEPVVDGGAVPIEPVVDGGAVPVEPGRDPATIVVNASSSGFDWSVALVVVLIGLVVLVTTVAVLNAATRRARQLPTP